MTAITYDKLKVTGYDFHLVQELKVTESLNCHTTLHLTGILKQNKKEEAIHETGIGKKIQVCYEDEGREKVLFHGMVNYVEVVKQEEVNFITIEAVDASKEMDLIPKSRSFQDASMTIKSLVLEVMSAYSGADWKWNLPDVPIGQLIVQYEETDWEFLKRVASKYYAALMPDCRLEGIHFYIGVELLEVKLQSPLCFYQVEKELEEYYFMKKNFTKDAVETDYTTYSMERFEVFHLGESLELEGHSFYILETVHEIKKGMLQNRYRMRPKNGLRVKTLYQDNLSGCSLEGTIAKVEKAKVLVALRIDKGGKAKPLHWFAFSTMSASEDGSGWYCMPEIGDQVMVYFPDKKEEKAFAVSAVSGYVQGENETEDRMGNPDNKYLRTAKDKQVQLTAAGIFISCDSGQASANIQSDGTLILTSQKNVSVTAEESMEIKAEETLMVTGVESITLACDKGGVLSFDKEGMMKELGTLVNNN